jgi:hypothetical protein
MWIIFSIFALNFIINVKYTKGLNMDKAFKNINKAKDVKKKAETSFKEI